VLCHPSAPSHTALHHKLEEPGVAQGHSQNVAVSSLPIRLEGPRLGQGCSRASCCHAAEQSLSLPQGERDRERNGATL